MKIYIYVCVCLSYKNVCVYLSCISMIYKTEDKFTHTSVYMYVCGYIYLKDGDTLLHIASKCGYEDVVTYLVTHGADVHARNQVRVHTHTYMHAYIYSLFVCVNSSYTRNYVCVCVCVCIYTYM